jgi:hypothetical protein
LKTLVKLLLGNSKIIQNSKISRKEIGPPSPINLERPGHRKPIDPIQTLVGVVARWVFRGIILDRFWMLLNKEFRVYNKF